MTTDMSALRDRIKAALSLSQFERGRIAQMKTRTHRERASREARVDALLLLIAAEVRKGQAEALRSARLQVSALNIHPIDAGAVVGWLRDLADDIENGDDHE